jgi:ABC-type molybdate transport system permease subunit
MCEDSSNETKDVLSISLPYLIVGGLAVVIQVVYLIIYKGRVSGIRATFAKSMGKFWANLFAYYVILMVMGIPFAIYLAMGIHLAANEKFVGIYVMLITSIHLLGLTFLFWYMRRWRLSLFVR